MVKPKPLLGFVGKLARWPESEQLFRLAKTAKQAMLVLSSMQPDAARRKKGRSKPDRVFRHSLNYPFILLLFLFPFACLEAQDLVRINEFVAVNDSGLDDEDRDEVDWIEIHNGGTTPVDMTGWYLTDRVNDLTKWRFPGVLIAPHGYLVVFASGKDRNDPAGPLHTNFKLSGDGEYLGLVRPDAATIASEFFPAYPIQAPDVSYGLEVATAEETLVRQDGVARALLPVDDALEPRRQSGDPRPWTQVDLDDSDWQVGTIGIGYNYAGLIGLDVSPMRNTNETIYCRVPFTVVDPPRVKSLTLRMRYDDGMIAYINGQEVARDNAPAPGTETWKSGAIANRSNRKAVKAVDFPLFPLDFLRPGQNVLAIQGLNNGLSSSDLLILPELVATVTTDAIPSLAYFPLPTPGRPNGAGVAALGPIIREPDHAPAMAQGDQDLRVWARIRPSSDGLLSARLHYRILFGPEIVVAMGDDGQGGDEIGGDGIYSAGIGAGAFRAGQLIRWYITATDDVGRVTRLPAFLDPENAPEYLGTVVDDPSLTNPLPVLHWFVRSPGSANSDAGTRCTLFYDGELYDNVAVNLHGQSSRGFPKKSYDIDFHPGHNFKWAPGQPRADDINLMTTYPDKAQMRNILSYETFRDADCPYHWVFPVRVQQNGTFWGTAHVMENGDEDWLIRMGVNVDGALYKMYNRFTSPGDATNGAEKKTRKHESNADLLALFNGISLAGESRRRYLYDHVDVPQVVNYLAALVITGNTDCCHKNYYLYRDTGRSNEWQMWPWDVDLSFGRRWISSHTYWDERLITNTRVFVGSNNRLPQAIFGIAEVRQMYLRRIRTLMDDLLKPPGVSPANQHYEPRMDELAALIAPDADLDAAKWNSHAWGQGSTAPCCPQSLLEAVAEMKYVYLPERRRQLYHGLASGAGEIPDAQPDAAIVEIGGIRTEPASGDPNEQFLQLHNPNRYAVDISGWALRGSIDLFFRGGTVIPAEGLLYVAADRVAFRGRPSFPNGGQALFIVGDYEGRFSSSSGSLELVNRAGRVVALVTDVQQHRPLLRSGRGR